MNQLITLCYKAIRKTTIWVRGKAYNPLAKLMMGLNGVDFGTNFRAFGLPYVHVTRTGAVTIGDNFSINSGNNYNVIGRQQKCIFWISGKLKIGNNVGMSASAIICRMEIILGNNIIIGGNSVIYDTDFHSLNPSDRLSNNDKINAKCKRVEIKDGVFIGAHSTILKGVTIGENAIIGACSVISKDVPANEIWAGNPAKFVRSMLPKTE